MLHAEKQESLVRFIMCMMYMYMYMCEGRVNLIIGMDAASSFHLYVVHMMNFTTLSRLKLEGA